MKRYISLTLLLATPYVMAEQRPQKELIEEAPKPPEVKDSEPSTDPFIEHLQASIDQFGLAMREAQSRSEKMFRGFLNTVDDQYKQIGAKTKSLSISEQKEYLEIQVILPEQLTIQKPSIEIANDVLFSVQFNDTEIQSTLEGTLDHHLLQVTLSTKTYSGNSVSQQAQTIRGNYNLENLQAEIQKESRTLTLRIPRNTQEQNNVRHIPISIT